MFIPKATLLKIRSGNPAFLTLIVLVIVTVGACTDSSSEPSPNPSSSISPSLNPIPSSTLSPTATPAPRSQSEIVAELRSAVVRVETSGPNGNFTGTGFVLSANTNIVATAFHVVDGATQIIVRRADDGDSASLVAELVAFDPITDLALLEVAGFSEGIELTTSQIEVGEDVLAMGFPLGLLGDVSVSQGIVSRHVEFEGDFFIQHDAEILQGNSGGPLIDSTGRLVGINILVVPDVETVAGLNFAVHVGELSQLMKSAGMVVEKIVGFPTPTPTPTPTVTPTATPSPTPTATATPTAAPTAVPTLTSQEIVATATAVVQLRETEIERATSTAIANEIQRGRDAEATATAAAIPTATAVPTAIPLEPINNDFRLEILNVTPIDGSESQNRFPCFSMFVSASQNLRSAPTALIFVDTNGVGILSDTYGMSATTLGNNVWKMEYCVIEQLRSWVQYDIDNLFIWTAKISATSADGESTQIWAGDDPRTVEVETFVFRVDWTIPSLKSARILGDAFDGETNTRIETVWNDNLRSSSISIADFSLTITTESDSSVFVAAEAQVSETDPSIMTLYFGFPLGTQGTWTIKIQGTVRDLSGNATDTGSITVEK